MSKKLPKYPFQDTSLSFEERVDDLISRIDLEEKFMHLTYVSPPNPELGIPAYDWWNECLHGVGRAGIATVFPQAIGLAAMFDAEFLHTIAVAISDEARAKHHDFVRKGDFGRNKGLTFWTPNVNIFRDPRWGRGQETYGEDPYLTGRLGVAFIKGLQGDHPKYFKLVATPKHYVVHSGPEADRHTFNAEANQKDLRETYLPHFKECVQEGKAYSVMCAYNRTNNELCCASPTFLQKILREEWGFDGYVVSDCGAIADFHEHHKVTQTAYESAALALNNGCDLNCGNVFWHLEEALERGLVTEETVDRSLKRLFLARFKLGMFDPPELVPYQNIPYDVVDCQAHRDMALEAAHQSIVLLKNENGILPLRKDLKAIAVIGPNADDPEVLLGNYNGTPSKSFTPLAGIQQAVGEGVVVKYAKGSNILDPVENGIRDAVAAAKDVDVIIACMGISNAIEGEENARTGLADRIDVGLPEVQLDLLKKLHDTGKPVILVLLNGGAVSTPWAEGNLPAIVEAWYPGEEGGTAIADVLFGKYNPSGRLPVTIVRETADLPPYEDYSMKGHTYRYLEKLPLFPFGFGLSFTTFEYSDIEISTISIPAGAHIEVSVSVKNSGSYSGEEVVQAYLRDEEATVTVPRWSLVGFQRVRLSPGQSKVVKFKVTDRQMAVITTDGSCILEPGKFTVFVGGQQPDQRSAELTGQAVLQATFEVTGEMTKIPY